jgi:hypothetical protein
MIDMKRAQMLGGDPADRKEASYWPEHEDRPEDIWADEWLEMCRRDDVKVCPDAVTHGKAAFAKTLVITDSASHRNAQRQALAQFLKDVSDLKHCPSPDLQYKADCLLVSFGLIEASQTQVADKHNVTRAAVSKRVVEIRNSATPKTVARLQKSLEARKVYALRQKIVAQTRVRIDLSNQDKETKIAWETN